MKLISFQLLFFVFLVASCKKDTISAAPETPTLTVSKPSVEFYFINRLGYLNDSVNDGKTYTVLRGPMLESIYYDKVANKSTDAFQTYVRYTTGTYSITSDSILFRKEEATLGSQYSFKVIMKWLIYDANTKESISGKARTFITKNYNVGDTIKSNDKVVVKFVWPIDTASGKFVEIPTL